MSSGRPFCREPGSAGLTVAGLLAVLLVAVPPAAAAEPSVEELLRKADDLWRGSSSVGTVTMRVKTARWQRELTMKIWAQGAERTLIRILDPAKERGTATLKVDNNIWNYLPKIDRTIKVPVSMMAGSWMGSHFTNDDLVRESRFVDDFVCELTARPRSPEGHYSIACIPRPDAAVVWGKVVVRVRAGDELVDEVVYYDEQEQKVRTVTYTDIGPLGGQRLPRRIRMSPADKPGEFTELVYKELSFNSEIPQQTFTLHALRR